MQNSGRLVEIDCLAAFLSRRLYRWLCPLMRSAKCKEAVIFDQLIGMIGKYHAQYGERPHLALIIPFLV